MRVLVFGCGPAGLIAAHAVATITGKTPAIASKPRKSELFGAQYLHGPIPGLEATKVAGTRIDYTLQGDTDSYRTKVYGELWHDKVSPEDLVGNHFAWDIRSAYDELWRRYGQDVIDLQLQVRGEQDAQSIRSVAESVDLVVSSVPKPILCYNPQHVFSSQTIWAAGDAPERGRECPVRVHENTVVCNGNQEPSWYRASNVFGYATAEWPENSKPPVSVSEVKKPLFNMCDCWPEIVHVGRYGTWEKGVLSHEAYNVTANALAAL